MQKRSTQYTDYLSPYAFYVPVFYSETPFWYFRFFPTFGGGAVTASSGERSVLQNRTAIRF